MIQTQKVKAIVFPSEQDPTREKSRASLLPNFVHTKSSFAVLLQLHVSIKNLEISILASFSISESIPRCLKITEKVSFNIASEASYVCILKNKNN